MSTIEKLAGLAEGATQDDRVSLQRYDHGGGRLAIFAPTRILIADFYIEADREYYAACSPAAIAQAAAEYAELVAERDRYKALAGELAEALYLLREHACLHSMNMRDERFSLRHLTDKTLAKYEQEKGV